MKKLENLRQLYDQTVQEMLADTNKWKAFLAYAGNMYKYDFATLVTAYAQNPELTQLASYDDWKSIGKQVRRNEKSIPVLIKNNNGIEHFFDVTQLQGKPQIWNWTITSDDLEEFNKRFMKKNQHYLSDQVISAEDIRQQMVLEQLRAAYSKTKQPEIKKAILSDFFFNSIHYMVEYRYHNTKPQIEIYDSDYINHETIGTIGYYTVKTAREILLASKEIVYDMRREKQHESKQEDRSNSKWNGNGIRGTERTLVRGSGGREEPGEHKQPNQIRQSGHEVLGRGETGGFAEPSDRWNTVFNHAKDTRTSRENDGRAAREDANIGFDQEPIRHHRDLSSQTKNSRSSGGNRTQGSSLQLTLDLDKLNEGMEKEEAKGVSSFLLSKSYGQAWIPDEVLEEAIHMGTGKEVSKEGIYRLYKEMRPIEKK